MKEKNIQAEIRQCLIFSFVKVIVTVFIIGCFIQSILLLQNISFFTSSILFLLGILFVSGYLTFKNTMSILSKKLIDPITSIRSADINSEISSCKIQSVECGKMAFEDIQKIASFRNEMIDFLQKKQKFSQYDKPLESSYSEIDKLLSGVIDALTQANIYNDNDTGNHMERLGLYSKFLASKGGLDSKFVAEVERYAPLHDVGKIGIPDSILKKEGRLTPEEWVVMKTHSKIGYDILKSVGMSTIAQNIALYHHENWIGHGYPEGLIGEDIPIEARLVAIADVFDALINKRVYKDPFSREKVEKIMLNEIGKKFDPHFGRIAYENLDEFYQIFNKNKESNPCS